MTCPDADRVRAWPFPVRPRAELPPTQRVFVDFLDAAHAEGFAPVVERGFSYHEASAAERGGTIFRRLASRDIWEVSLWRPEAPRTMSGFVRGADVATGLVLRWLRGADEAGLWDTLCAIATKRFRHGEFVGEGDPLPGE